jgi:hypothetical protein
MYEATILDKNSTEKVKIASNARMLRLYVCKRRKKVKRSTRVSVLISREKDMLVSPCECCQHDYRVLRRIQNSDGTRKWKTNLIVFRGIQVQFMLSK